MHPSVGCTSVPLVRAWKIFAVAAWGGLLGCDQISQLSDPDPPPAPAVAPTTAEQPASNQPASGEAVSPEPGQPCIVGQWKANDFLETVRGSLGESPELRDVELTREGGSITFRLTPLQNEVGELTAVANSLVHRAEANIQGIQGSASHRMHGRARMPYRLSEPDQMTIEAATEGELGSRVTVETNVGIQFDRGVTTPTRFPGRYDYECDDGTLIVRRLENNQPSNPVRFTRITEEEYAQLTEGVEVGDLPPASPSNERSDRAGAGGGDALRALRRAAEAFRKRAANAQ